MRRAIVIDGNSIMFRAYFATAAMNNLMQNQAGLYTNAIYGFANMIQHIINTTEYDNILVAFDKGKKTLRHQAYEDYKGGRNKTPDELIMQIPFVKEYLDVLGIKHLELDDYEADDIVGSYANKVKDNFDEVLVFSGDRDLLQLAKGNIHVCLTKTGTTDVVVYTEENFKELMGINVSQMVDYKGMIGDNSDNLPGIEKIGPIKACQLLEKYQTLEGVIEHAEEIGGKTKDYILRDQDQARRSRDLAKLYLNVDMEYGIDNTKKYNPSVDSLIAFYNKVGFKSFIKKLLEQKVNSDSNSNNEISNQEEVKKEPIIKVNYHFDEIDSLKEKLKISEGLYLDVEITGENYHTDNVLGISILIEEDGYFISENNIPFIKEVLEKFNGYILAIDIKKCIVALNRFNIHLNNYCFDLTLASYVINPQNSSDDIKNVITIFKENNLPFIENIYEKKTKYNVPSLNVYGKYAIDKLYWSKEVQPIVEKEINKYSMDNLLFDIEIPLAIVLADMEINGFKVSNNRLNELKVEIENSLSSIEKEVYELAGEEFNIASPKQLGEILFDKLGLASGKKNKTGYSTSADVLEKLAKVHPLPRKVLEYRKFAKLYNTYIIGLMNAEFEDEKLHTIFKQSLTLTGRLSSVEPNIQNIPIRTDDGRLIRSAFIPSNSDGLLVSADYSQIELRILAHLAKCPKMIDMFNSGYDLHSGTASLIFEKKMEDITKQERRMAKAVNFGIVYGMSSFGLAEELEISPVDAQKFIKKYFETFPEIKDYLNKVVEDCKANGYTETMFKRRRYINEINSSNGILRQFGERTAKNAPIQGSAADIIKIAMINVYKEFNRLNLKSKLIAQVHDELIIDTVNSEEETVKKVLKETMENVVSLSVKLNAEVAFGKNWDMK